MTIEELLEPLKEHINIYDEYNHVGKDNNYIVYREVTDTPLAYGNGKVLIRSKNYDVDLFCTRQDRSFFMQLVENHLKNKVNYTKITVGYNTTLQRYQYTYTFYLY